MGLADLLWPQVAGVGFKLDKVLKTLYIRNRIVGHGEEDPASFVANPRNWRIHPKEQADALGAALAEVGWVQSVIVNRRSGFLIDGHLRVLEADRLGAKSIPVGYVDLSDEEEAKAIATLDPLAAVAATDSEKLKDLLAEIEAEQPALQAMLDDLAERSGLGSSASEEDDPGARIELADELLKKWKVQSARLGGSGATACCAATGPMPG